MIEFEASFVGYIEPAYKSDTLKTFNLKDDGAGGLGCFFTVAAQELTYNDWGRAKTVDVYYDVACYDTLMTSKVLDLFKARAHVKVFCNNFGTRTWNGKRYSRFTMAYIERFTPESSATPEEKAVLAGLTT